MTKYFVIGREIAQMYFTFISLPNVDEAVYFSSFGSKEVLIGTSVRKTRKGFYYFDAFFKERFVTWKSLRAVEC